MDLKEQLKALEEGQKALSKVHAKTKTMVKDFAVEHDALADQHNALHEAHEDLREGHQDLKSAHKSLRVSHNGLRSSVKALAEQVDALAERVDDMDSDNGETTNSFRPIRTLRELASVLIQ